MKPTESAATPSATAGTQTARQFSNFLFFKLLPSWRALSPKQKDRACDDFAFVVGKYADRIQVYSYSLIGIRAEVDLMLWRISESLEFLEQMACELYQSGIGPYLATPYSYLAMTRRSIYVEQHQHAGSESSRARLSPSNAPYLFVYPFVKTREWYQLPKNERQAMMDAHIATGHKYSNVKINTTYSFGMDDQEFVVAFETDSPASFLDLVMELRESPASRFTVRDTPAFTCLAKPLSEILRSL